MTLSYTPAGCPAIWMQFTPAEEDNCEIEGMVHTGMANETICVGEEVSTEAENISENGVSEKGAGPHIRSVERASQLRTSRLAECEYQRDCISVGKEQADGLSDNYFDSLNLATTTGRSRDAVVVGLRLRADQLGSRNDRLTPPLFGLDRMLRIRQDDDSSKNAASLDSRLRGNDVMGYCRITAF